jgi:prepilin-type processing-associated H-X9-DG protein
MERSGGIWFWIGVIPVIAAVAGAGWFFYGLLGKAAESAHRASCFGNFRQIGLGIKQYAQDHGGKHPDSFALLLKEAYITTTKVFVCPSTNTRVPDDFPTMFKTAGLADLKRIDAIADYEMVRGLDNNASPDFILLYERPSNHKGEGLNVGYMDGHVQWHTVEEFQRLMNAQRDEMDRMQAPRLRPPEEGQAVE